MYRVEVAKSARRFLRQIHPEDLLEIIERLRDLREDPYPGDAAELRGHPGYFRLRVGGYRIIYRVSQSRDLVYIGKIGPRKTIYRGY